MKFIDGKKLHNILGYVSFSVDDLMLDGWLEINNFLEMFLVENRI